VIEVYIVDNMSYQPAQAEIDALELKRGPPDSLFFAGAGDYMATILKPALEREARERTRFEQTQNAPVGGGPAAVPRFRVATDEDKEQTLREQLARAEATMVASEPVHFYDLKETAARKTQELIERDKQILHFTAYTLERVDNSQIENQRTRVMEFFYRIGDATLHVFEPPQANSGLYQVS
jgi:hypothetical protein